MAGEAGVRTVITRMEGRIEDWKAGRFPGLAHRPGEFRSGMEWPADGFVEHRLIKLRSLLGRREWGPVFWSARRTVRNEVSIGPLFKPSVLGRQHRHPFARMALTR